MFVFTYGGVTGEDVSEISQQPTKKKTTRARGEGEKRVRSKVSLLHCNHRDAFKTDHPNMLDCPVFVFILMETFDKSPSPPPQMSREASGAGHHPG